MLELAVLGLLKEQPLHGYELRKRLGDTLGFLWGVSYGSLYPALRRMEKAGDIEVVAPDAGLAIPAGAAATGSIGGEVAAARRRRRPARGPRNKKAYRITPQGEETFARLLAADDHDDERAFALKFAFCAHLGPEQRLTFLERRRRLLADRLDEARASGGRRGDFYLRSLAEHRARSVERDLEWVDGLIAAERASTTGGGPPVVRSERDLEAIHEQRDLEAIHEQSARAATGAPGGGEGSSPGAASVRGPGIPVRSERDQEAIHEQSARAATGAPGGGEGSSPGAASVRGPGIPVRSERDQETGARA